MHRHEILVALVASAILGGCSSSDSGSGTTGKTVTLKTSLDIADDLTQPKTNALGWSVTLTSGYLSVGSLYYFAGDPLLSQAGATPGPWALNRLLDCVERPAYAHPGHYIHGDAMGQMTVPTTVDLFGARVEALGVGTGVTGSVNSARFTWQTPPAGDLAAKLQGHVVWTQGVATKGASMVHFIAKADAADVVDGDGLPKVDGCAFGPTPGKDGAVVDGDGTVTLTLVPTVWFDQVDFSYLVPGAHADAGTSDASTAEGASADASAADEDEGDAALADVVDAAPQAAAGNVDASATGEVGTTASPVDITGTLAWEGFLRGVKKGTGYLFSYSK